MKQEEQLLNRQQLAHRWNCSVRKVDRMRKYGILTWIDISAGKGTKPTVRFQLETIQEFECQHEMSVSQKKPTRRLKNKSCRRLNPK